MGNTAGHGTYGYFSLHSSFLHVLTGSRELSKRLTAFHLHIEIPEEVVLLLLVLYHYSCDHIKLHYSYPIGAQRQTQTHTHSSPSGMLEPRGACYDLALLSCWPRRERITSVGKQAVHMCVCVCTIYECLVVMGAGGGCTSFELRALSRDKLLRHRKATWSISLFSWCQDHFMWWWFDAWALGLLLPLSDWAMIVRAGIAGITEWLGSSHQKTAIGPLAVGPHWQIPFLLSHKSVTLRDSYL